MFKIAKENKSWDGENLRKVFGTISKICKDFSFLPAASRASWKTATRAVNSRWRHLILSEAAD